MASGKKVIPGQSLNIPAADYNSFIDAANDLKTRQQSTDFNRESLTEQHTVLIRNDTGQIINRFGIVGLGRSLILPENNLDEFQNQISFTGVLPGVAHENKFAILIEPLEPDELGSGLITGVSLVHVQVDNDDHNHAIVRSGITGLSSMKSSGSGLARILWREGGIGLQWAIVALGGAGGDSGTTNRFATVSSILPGTSFVVVQPVDFVQSTEENPTPDHVLENVGDTEIVFVWPHLQTDDYRELIPSGPVTFISTPVIELKSIGGEWYAAQTVRFRIKPIRTDLIKGTC